MRAFDCVLLGLLRGLLLFAAAVVLGAASISALADSSTAFSYQGKIIQSGVPFTGTCNLTLKLFDALQEGSQVGSTIVQNNVTVTGGVFTVVLDFGSGAFTGPRRWLETSMNGQIISPRREINAAPYAVFAQRPWQTSGADVYYTGGKVGIGTSAPSSALSVSGDADVTGSVGIGTAAPFAKLDVVGGDIRIASTGSGLVFPDGSRMTTLPTGLPAGGMILTASSTPPSGFTFTGRTMSADGAWTARTPMLSTRAQFAASELGGKVYALGGIVPGSNASRSVDEYDVAGNSWRAVAPMQQGRSNHAAASAGGKVYAFGGDNGGAGKTVEEYDPVQNTWTAKAPMPTARCYAGAAMLGGRIYVVGGETTTGWSNTVDVYDPATNSWAGCAPMSTSRCYHSVVASEGKLYALGGRGAANSYLDTVEAYDPGTNTWSFKAPMLVATSRAGAAGIGSRIYVVGGQYSTAVQEYDPSADKWRVADHLPQGRWDDLQAVGLGGGLRLFGGTIEGNASNTAVEYLPSAVYYLHVKD